jgi:PAS domain S-box-containing protein
MVEVVQDQIVATSLDKPQAFDAKKTRTTGIPIVGNVSWGTHFCLFYQNKDDLINALAPFFKAGLENNEFCMLVTSEPLTKEEAENALRKTVPDFDRYLKKGQIEIVPHDEWYLKNSVFDLQRVLGAWIEKLESALDSGYDGIRVAGNTAWLEKRDWKDFADYEEKVNSVIGNYRMIVVCSCSLDKCNASEVVDVVHNHQFALVRRGGNWEVLESSQLDRTRKMLQQSQQQFESLFMGNPEASVHLDTQFHIINVNPRFLKLFGYSAEEVKGKNIDDVVVPEDMREEAESLNKDAKNGYASHNTVRKRKNGSLMPVSISAAPVTFENKLLGYVGIYKDITDLKKAQQESEESRKHFQTLFDLMADPVAVVDGRGKILEATRKVEEITGFKKEELVGKNFLKIEMFGAKTKAVMIKSLAKRLMGMNLQPYEVEVLKKDGGKLMYEINAAKIDYKGKPADLVVFRDILERKNLEEKLRVVGGLTRHDVRNKLSAVTGNAYLLKRKLVGNPEALEQLADMENAVRNAEAIFEFARTYEKLGVEKLVNMNVGKAVDEATSLFTDLKGIKIVNECHDLTVLADSLLRQLFHNLIDNTLKYGEKTGQIRIYSKTSSADKLELVYEDDGVGIPNDMRSSLFKEGFTSGKGTGYGLFMMKRICEVYGWAIRETGEPGKGAQFIIAIPKISQKGKENYETS